MAYNPEFDQNKISVMEAGRCLLGALARTHLKIAILEAENKRKRIDSRKRKRLKDRFTAADHVLHVREDYETFRRAWERERKTLLPPLNALKKKTTGKKEELINQKIIDPLWEIYTRTKGKRPSLSQLGGLLIKTALEREGTEKVSSFLSQFDLDPNELVQEVYDALTLFGEKDRINLA
ncbi:hypothetical protein KKI19_02920 [Patescibacteria group bacterium]|nr:hypothetical protein [Patescibacteria group bacterium]